MGLFGGSTTYVSSTLYNLAGEPLERANYLKTTVLSGYLLGDGQPAAETITNSYLKGPGIKIRSFFRWAEINYDGIGVPTGSLSGSGSVDAATVLPFIPKDDPGNIIDILQVQSGTPDFTNWVEQWLLANEPDAMGTAYEADIDETTGFITIVFEDTTEASFLPSAPIYNPNSMYLYVAYTETVPAVVGTGTPEAPEFPEVVTTLMWIYMFGSGNTTLDALILSASDDGEYIPYVPIRLNNSFLSPSYYPDSYALAKKAYKKVSGGNLDKIIEKLNDNEDLEEIDYAYIFFGVPLNVLDNSARTYLYMFFDRLRLNQTNSNAEWLLYQSQLASGELVTAPTNVVQVKSTGSLNTNINMKVTWNAINRETGLGPGRLGAIAGDYWVDATTVSGEDNVVQIWHQIDDNSWEKLIVIGAVHDNLIYNNKSVTITAKEALEDLDESGFLLPIHYDTFRDMGLKDSTQLATQASFLVLNSYKVVKKKWYQTGIFKIFLFVVVAALIVVTAGAATGAGAGLLGSAAAVGAAVGLTGTLGLIAGAIANALVAMLVMKGLTAGTSALFGKKLGAIIGAIVSLVTLQVGTSLMNGASLAASWGSLMSADSLLRLTEAVGSGVAGYIRAGAMETLARTQDMVDEYEKQTAELSQKFAEQFGYDKASLDPLSLTDVNIGNAMESEFQFLSRTLMTGSDIAEMSKDMLTNFVEYTLALNPGKEGVGG